MSLGVWEEVADQDEIEHYARLRREREERIKNYMGTRAIVAVSGIETRPRGVVSRKWETTRDGGKITLSQTLTISHPSSGGEMFPERETIRKTRVGTFTLSPREAGVKPCILRFSLSQNRKGARITPTDDAQLTWDEGQGVCPIEIGVNTAPLRGVVARNPLALDMSNARVNGVPVAVLEETRTKEMPKELPCKNAALRVVLKDDQAQTVGWLLVGRIEPRPSHSIKTTWVEGESDLASAKSSQVLVGGKTPNCWHFIGKGKFTC